MTKSPVPAIRALTLSLLVVFSAAGAAMANDASEIHIRTQQDPSTGAASYEAFTPQGKPRGFIQIRCYRDAKGETRAEVETNFPAKDNQGHSPSKDDIGRALFMQMQAGQTTVCDPQGRPDPRAAKALLRNVNNAQKVIIDKTP